jgi:sugar phosphate isomerase/epimerase
MGDRESGIGKIEDRSFPSYVARRRLAFPEPRTPNPEPRSPITMIRNPLGLRLDPDRPVRDQIYEAARLGARGVVVDAIADLAPQRLSETGRREFRHILRTVELSLIAVSLPTRRPFDTTDQLDERLRRAEAAFAMAFELGTDVVLARVGPIPPQEDAARREVLSDAVRDLGRRAEYRGVRLAIETGTDPGETLRAFLQAMAVPSLAVSIDPGALLQAGIDPVPTVRELAEWVAHAYASDGTGTSRVAAPNPRGFGYPPGALDWEEYLGALEEIGYHGFLTVWPPPGRTAAVHFAAISERLKRLG